MSATAENDHGAPAVENRSQYAEHVRTYARFLHMMKWFVIHMVLDLVALYFLVIQPIPGLGWPLLALAFVGLIYGAATLGRAANEAEERIPAHGEAIEPGAEAEAVA